MFLFDVLLQIVLNSLLVILQVPFFYLKGYNDFNLRIKHYYVINHVLNPVL